MKQKELPNPFVMIQNWKNLWSPWFNLYSAGIDFGHQNLTLTSKINLRTVRVKIFLMAVDPDVYNDFKLKKTFGLHVFFTKNIQCFKG